MKAAQITGYNKDIKIMINDVPIPEIRDDEVLIRSGHPFPVMV